MGERRRTILDEVRIWNTARTQQQIQDNMNKELSGDEPGLVGYWKFNEGQGTTVYDNAGNNHGTIHGATWVDGMVESYLSEAHRLSPPLSLSTLGTALSSTISWQATTPTGTGVTVESSLSFDNGTTWSNWQACTNGGAIPGMAGKDLSNALLRLRQTLETTDTSVTPLLKSLTLSIQGEKEGLVTVYYDDGYGCRGD